MLLILWLAVLLYHTISSVIAFSTTDSPQKKDSIHHIPSLGGVTSILSSPHVPSSDTSTYFIGTKRGKIKQVNIPIDLNTVQSNDILQTIQIEDIEDANGTILKPYPIFSLHDYEVLNNHDVLAGGGDRYITVWRQNKQGDWTVVDQLGPHTGWVKDLAIYKGSSFDSEEETHNMYIFSIGCNCIEVWCTIDGVYKHVHKLQIDSSVEMGCTLSSDLLCLATYAEESKSKEEKKKYIFSAGVDGRIHRWCISNNEFLSAGTFSAHDGRVNGLAVCQSMGVLVSVGSDGYVHFRLMDSTSNPSEWKWKVVSLDISKYFRKDSDTISIQRKATSLCIVNEDSRKAEICVGTSCGQVLLINIDKSDDDVIHASFMKYINIASNGVKGNVVVHALCSNQYEDSSRIQIGHSNGLTIWDVPLST